MPNLLVSRTRGLVLIVSPILWSWDEQNCSVGWGGGGKEKDRVAQAWDGSSSVPRVKQSLFQSPSDHGPGPCWDRWLKEKILVWNRKHLRLPDSQGIQEYQSAWKGCALAHYQLVKVSVRHHRKKRLLKWLESCFVAVSESSFQTWG